MIYEELPFNLDKSNVRNFHVHAYYGELELFKKYLDVEIINHFLETSKYCIIKGCKRSFEFAEFCLNNFKFSNNFQTYKTSGFYDNICISYILNGVWDPVLNSKLNILEIFRDLCYISDINLAKICLIEELKDIASYLCILKQKKSLFDTIIEPVQTRRITGLVKSFPLINYFNGSIEYTEDRAGGITPINLNYGVFDEHLFTDEVFENKFTFDNLICLFHYDESVLSILDFCCIDTFERYICLNEILTTDKEINRYNIIDDARVCRRIDNNLSKCVKFAINGSFDCLYPDMFLEYVYRPYNTEMLEYASEGQKWSIIYSLCRLNLTLKPKYLDYFDYLEYNAVKAIYDTFHRRNNGLISGLIAKGYKCFKVIDFDNKKYIDKIEIDIKSIEKDKIFDINKMFLKNDENQNDLII